ncbi:hypothetical protein GCM10007857_89760 [Bradyrhizobium iriomotense]|uniref:Uncharacterized protein n=1 Tax=Bradyrhizobium iriomotense TaxID=441950 RepID=A0ABQ6BFN1_9BRAD|nr:hypothetical protein GCM10007857_89760 [Bradyrhizobium iriomotense]
MKYEETESPMKVSSKLLAYRHHLTISLGMQPFLSNDVTTEGIPLFSK